MKYDELIARLREGCAGNDCPSELNEAAAALEDQERELEAARKCECPMCGTAHADLLTSQLRVERDAARADNMKLAGVLLFNGFVECDIPACNCGSWHHRYGLPERWDEIKSELAESGHPLRNANGHSVMKALRELIADRDVARAECEALRKDAEMAGKLLHSAPGLPLEIASHAELSKWTDAISGLLIIFADAIDAAIAGEKK